MTALSRIEAPQVLSVKLEATASEPSVALRVMRDGDVYQNVELVVQHPLVPLTATKVRRLRLATIRRDLVRAELAKHNAELSKGSIPVRTYLKGTDGRRPSEKDVQSPQRKQLDNAALVVTFARLVGDPVVRSVARSFGLEKPEAVRWVRLALASEGR